MECGLESSLTCLDSNLRVHCTCACPQREEKSSERAFWRMHPKWIGICKYLEVLDQENKKLYYWKRCQVWRNFTGIQLLQEQCVYDDGNYEEKKEAQAPTSLKVLHQWQSFNRSHVWLWVLLLRLKAGWSSLQIQSCSQRKIQNAWYGWTSWYLGIQVAQCQDSVRLTQRTYSGEIRHVRLKNLARLLQRFISWKIAFQRENSHPRRTLKDIIGSLMYAVIGTRPNMWASIVLLLLQGSSYCQFSKDFYL